MIDAPTTMTESVRAEFSCRGYSVLTEFYDAATDIAPIQEGIRQILELACRKYGVDGPTGTAAEAMTLAYPRLIAENRAWGGEIYDAIKQIPAFMRLVCSARNDEVFKALRPDSIPGIAAGGYGMRIDNPGEEKFRAQWHQEFPSQLRSVDGIVFWTPLLPVTADMGPVQIAEGSHAEGLVPVYEDDAGAGKAGAYALHLDNAEERLARYKIVAPLTVPGDLVLMDFLTLHQSGHNVSALPRWSIQFRYFNFAEPVGVRIGWKGSFAAGVKFADVLPELVARPRGCGMRNCRVCGVAIEAPAYHAPAPALTSIMTLIDTPTHVFACDGCGHAQCDDIPEIQAFYDKAYRISLASEGHDQIFTVKADGAVIYRTDHQAEIALHLLDLPQGARVLDYGAAKADTLRKMHAARPDIQPHVFDVSKDYAAAWRGWVPQEAQAAYSVPPAWAGRFDAVMSHFVIEHVADPITFLRTLSALLRPGGMLLLSLPDVSANPGDMMVADHLNHFTEASLRRALAAADLAPKAIDTKSFPGAFFAVAGRVAGAAEEVPAAVVAQAIARTRGICDLWKLAEEKLEKQATVFTGRKAAIYGAGFYGSWIYCRIVEKVDLVCFLDRNPHLQGTTRFGVPVLPPDEIADDVEVLVVGLNPLKAREAIAAQPLLQRPRLHYVWI